MMSRAELALMVIVVMGCGSSTSGSGEPSGSSAASSAGSSTATAATSVASAAMSTSGGGGGGGEAGAGGRGGMGGAGGSGGQPPTAEECEQYSSTDPAQAWEDCIAAGCRMAISAQIIAPGEPDVCADAYVVDDFILCIQTSEPFEGVTGSPSIWYRIKEGGLVEYLYASGTRCDMLGWIPCDDQDPAHPLCACIPSSCGFEE